MASFGRTGLQKQPCSRDTVTQERLCPWLLVLCFVDCVKKMECLENPVQSLVVFVFRDDSVQGRLS